MNSNEDNIQTRISKSEYYSREACKVPEREFPRTQRGSVSKDMRDFLGNLLPYSEVNSDLIYNVYR